MRVAFVKLILLQTIAAKSRHRQVREANKEIKYKVTIVDCNYEFMFS